MLGGLAFYHLKGSCIVIEKMESPKKLRSLKNTWKEPIYKAHEDPGIPAHTRMLWRLKIQRVKELMEDPCLDHLLHLRKHPAAFRSKVRALEYGFIYFNTSLQKIMESRGIVFDNEDEEKHHGA